MHADTVGFMHADTVVLIHADIDTRRFLIPADSDTLQGELEHRWLDVADVNKQARAEAGFEWHVVFC